jgi:hypothetical protein
MELKNSVDTQIFLLEIHVQNSVEHRIVKISCYISFKTMVFLPEKYLLDICSTLLYYKPCFSYKKKIQKNTIGLFE